MKANWLDPQSLSSYFLDLLLCVFVHLFSAIPEWDLEYLQSFI